MPRKDFMTQKDLKKLSRADLLEMLIEQSSELEAVKKKLEKTEAALQNKELAINTAGSLAEASLKLNGVFEAAELAGKQYLDNIQSLSQRQETICRKLESDSIEKADRLLFETQKKCAELESETKIKCAEMTAKAKAESKEFWLELSAKLEVFYEEHAGLKDLMSVIREKDGTGLK